MLLSLWLPVPVYGQTGVVPRPSDNRLGCKTLWTRYHGGEPDEAKLIEHPHLRDSGG
jgi:hypothetical protein